MASADDWATGEYGTLSIWQSVNDHLFTRMTYNEKNYDNTVSFLNDNVQTVWFWLDDDEIYHNEKVQALTPVPYNQSGDLYDEITYNSGSFDIYLPMTIRLIKVDGAGYKGGNRFPSTSSLLWSESSGTIIVDGIYYRKYTVVIYNINSWGCHLSAKDAAMYMEQGALKKDDAPLFALYLINDNQAVPEGLISDMIIANQSFSIREGAIAGWNPNDYNFFYGIGGNNESQRFFYYTRVHIFGSNGIYISGDMDFNGILDIEDVVILINQVLGGGQINEVQMQYLDLTGDGIIDITDVVYLIDLILNNNE